MPTKKTYNKRKSAGLCVSCGTPAESGSVLCSECRSKKNAYAREIYEWRKSLGLCVKCGQEKAVGGSVYCLVCRFDHSEKQREYYIRNPQSREQSNKRRAEKGKELHEKRSQEHLCTRCGKPLVNNSTGKRCLECALKAKKTSKAVREKSGIIPRSMFGNGIYCGICGKPVEEPGARSCFRCRENSRKNMKKAREMAPTNNYFRKANNALWKELNPKGA